MDPDEHDSDMFMIAAFGITNDPYAICPSCFREIGPDTTDDYNAEYRQRVRVFYLTRGIVLRKTLNGQWEKVPC